VGVKSVKNRSLRVAATVGAVLLLGTAPAVAAPAEVLDVGGTPVAVVVGADGTAYVGNYDGAGGLRVIPPGAARPSRTISTGTHVSGLAMAPDGTLYVAHQDIVVGSSRPAGPASPGAFPLPAGTI
jgi:hypothetical protein